MEATCKNGDHLWLCEGVITCTMWCPFSVMLGSYITGSGAGGLAALHIKQKAGVEWLKGPSQMIYSCSEFHSAPTWLVLLASPSIALFNSPAKVFSVDIEMDCSPATTHKHIQSISNLLHYKNQCGVFTAASSLVRLRTPDGFDCWGFGKALSHLHSIIDMWL